MIFLSSNSRDGVLLPKIQEFTIYFHGKLIDFLWVNNFRGSKLAILIFKAINTGDKMKIINDEKIYRLDELQEILYKIIDKARYLNEDESILDIDIDIPKQLITENLGDGAVDLHYQNTQNYLMWTGAFTVLFPIVTSFLPDDDKMNRYSQNRLKHCMAVFKYFVEHGADINAKDSNGNTPIMAFFLGRNFNAGSPIVLETILALHPDLSIKNNAGQSLLDLCYQHFQRDHFLDEQSTERLLQLQRKMISSLLDAGLQFTPEQKITFKDHSVFKELFREAREQHQASLLVQLTTQMEELLARNIELMRMQEQNKTAETSSTFKLFK